MSYRVVINGHDYTQYIKQKTGFSFGRVNSNDEDAGRDEADEMHTNVIAHQRKIGFKMGPMAFTVASQLEHDLQDNDDGVVIEYPDLYDGMCSRLFYNTSIESAFEQFTEDGIVVDNVNFTVISVKEATV